MSQSPETEPEILDSEAAPVSWEDDENSATLFLRAAFALVAGALLIWTQRNADIDSSENWGRWIWASIICNLLLPLGIIWLFFGQGLSRPQWLKDQKYNAWNYGWDFQNWKRHGKIALLIFALMLPLLWFYARVPEVRAYYEAFYPAKGSTPSLLVLLATTIIYMLCWEWFFRGFLLFGMAQGFGFILSIIFQAALFGLAHWGKPREEMISSFIGGAILGIICWREKSFAPAFYAHALIHVAWIFFVFYG